MGQVVYLTGTSLPTPQAHGVHIVKMCEAFARLGGAVTLLYPQWGRYRDQRPQASLFEYYGVPRIFDARPLRHVDLRGWRGRLPRLMGTPMAKTHYLLWGLVAALEARRCQASLYVTRNVETALWLVLLRLPTLLDLHERISRGGSWLLAPLKRSRHLMAVSTLTSYSKDWLLKVGFPSDKTAVLPVGVDLRLFAELPSAEACRERLGLPVSAPTVGYVGRFQSYGHEKGIPELVRAMGLLGARADAAPLLLCVGGPKEVVPKYMRVAAEAGLARHRVRFVDQVPTWEVPFWIRACDVVTIPWPWSEYSAYATSPLKLFEYMAAERAIVASDLPSIREILGHGRDAWLVKAGDPEALAGGIDHLLSAPEVAAELARHARQTVRGYTWERRAAAMWQRARRG